MADGRDAYDGLAERIGNLPRDTQDEIARLVMFPHSSRRDELARVLRDRGVLGDLAKFRAWATDRHRELQQQWVDAEDGDDIAAFKADELKAVLAKMDEMGM